MVDVVYWLPTGGRMAVVDRLGPKVGSHLALFLYSSREPGELSQCSKYDDITINIVQLLLLFFKILLLLLLLLLLNLCRRNSPTELGVEPWGVADSTEQNTQNTIKHHKI